MQNIVALIEEHIKTISGPQKVFKTDKEATAHYAKLKANLVQIYRAVGELTSIITNSGNGNLFLANDGFYKPINVGDAAVEATNKISYTLTAGETINGGRALILSDDGKAYGFDINNPSHYDKYIGVAETAALQNGQTQVVSYGQSNYIGSDWIPGKAYYIGSSGFLVDTPPNQGLVKQVGVGINNTTINIVSNTQIKKL